MKSLLDDATRKRIQESREECRKRDTFPQAAPGILQDKPQSVSGTMTTDNAMVEPIYTIEEVTKILKLKNTRTVQGWLKDGKMRGFKAGKEWRVTESALTEFINKGGGE